MPRIAKYIEYSSILSMSLHYNLFLIVCVSNKLESEADENSNVIIKWIKVWEVKANNL